ncbi:MAG: DUF1735 domain-containing protein [Bacteroidales bacterium]
MKKSNVKYLITAAIIAISLSSCLNTIENLSVTGTTDFLESSYVSPGTVDREIIDPLKPATFRFKVTIASSSVLDKDTKVTLALDNTLIDNYNALNKLTGADAAIPVPLAALTITSYQVIVPADSTEVDWAFTIDALKLQNPVNSFYVVPVKIVTAENGIVPGSNFSTMLVRILFRNEMDGIYLMKGFVMRPGDTGGLEGYFKGFEYRLITVRSNSVKMDYGQAWANGGAVGDIEAGWTITVNNATPAASHPIIITDALQGNDFAMVPGYASRYDVASRTFYWSVVWGNATPKNRGCTDTLVYQGPR